jgi:hypothetical protein
MTLYRWFFVGRVLGLALLFLSMAGVLFFSNAQEPTPRLPQSKITEAEWATFFNEVKAKPGAQDASRPDRPDIVAIAVEREGTMYYFTKPGPAHPAVVIAQVVQRDGTVFLRHNGYYAGSEQAFARWFKGFTDQVDKMRRSLDEQGGPQP